MKPTYFTRMAIPLLGIAFGFFIGCSSLSSQKNSTNDNLSEADLEERLNQIESQITKSPDNADAYYQKGNVLYRLAQRQKPPQRRSRYYQEMHQTLDEAGAVYRTSANQQGIDKIDELLKVSWSFEHNQGVEILQTDSTLDTNDLNTAASHFNNAIIIIPDSTVSYKMKARAQYRNHKVDQAIQTLEAANSRIDNLPATFIEQLAFLYLENNNSQKAINLYEKAESFSSDNLNLLHGLANAYITAEKHKEAVQLLATLVENKPDNIIYLESYGSELYKLGIQQYNSLEEINSNDSLSIRQTKATADTMLNQAKNQYKQVLQQNPEKTELKKQLADLYKNHAAKLTQVKPVFSGPAQEEIEKGIKSNLNEAVTLYEELVDQQPDQSEYWENLYQAYSYLGMQDEAEEAKVKANL